jgi:hypothetical protein
MREDERETKPEVRLQVFGDFHTLQSLTEE